MGTLTERLDQHRGRGQQQTTLKHVTVNVDQALVADTIITGKPLGPRRALWGFDSGAELEGCNTDKMRPADQPTGEIGSV